MEASVGQEDAGKQDIDQQDAKREIYILQRIFNALMSRIPAALGKIITKCSQQLMTEFQAMSSLQKTMNASSRDLLKCL